MENEFDLYLLANWPKDNDAFSVDVLITTVADMFGMTIEEARDKVNTWRERQLHEESI